MDTEKPKCPRCGGEVAKSGTPFRRGEKRQRYLCKDCGYAFVP